MDQKSSKSEFGVGKPVRRKEDERFLKGRGEYVGDIRLDNMHEVAFVRSPVAHARLTRVDIPPEYRDAVFTWDDMIGVNPIVSAPPEKSYKRSQQPILATGKLRYVGELVAMCVARTRAEAEDIAEQIELDLDELPPLAAPQQLALEERRDAVVLAALPVEDPIGLRALLAQSHFLLARALEESGHAADASPHYAQARQIADSIKEEAKTDSIINRSDLAPIFAHKT